MENTEDAVMEVREECAPMGAHHDALVERICGVEETRNAFDGHSTMAVNRQRPEIAELDARSKEILVRRAPPGGCMNFKDTPGSNRNSEAGFGVRPQTQYASSSKQGTIGGGDGGNRHAQKEKE